MSSNSSDSLEETLMPGGIGGVWAAASQLLLCNGKMKDLFQVMD